MWWLVVFVLVFFIGAAICFVKAFTYDEQPELLLRHSGKRRARISGSGFHSIGRARKAKVALPEDTYVSEEHARIWFDGNDFWLADAGSRNGTYLNGMLVESPRDLSESDRITVGETTLVVEEIRNPSQE